MSLKFLAQLSHFVTLMFGVALGITLCILYQFKIGIFYRKFFYTCYFFAFIFLWVPKDL